MFHPPAGESKRVRRDVATKAGIVANVRQMRTLLFFGRPLSAVCRWQGDFTFVIRLRYPCF